MNKSLIEFIEANGSWRYDSGFFVIDQAPEGDSPVITAEATFLDLEGYYGEWERLNGYYVTIHPSTNMFQYWIKKYGDEPIIDDGFKEWTDARMAAFNKVCELI
jgi:hypothetical protein